MQIQGVLHAVLRFARFQFFYHSDLRRVSSESKGPKYEIFPPAGGKGAIVVVASGNSGPGLYRDFSSKRAGLGCYTVLMDGKDLFDPGSIGLIVPGMENLQTVIAESKFSPQAIIGKVSLVVFQSVARECCLTVRS